jgi:antitoxin YefM
MGKLISGNYLMTHAHHFRRQIMYAYKEILTLDNPQQINLSQPLPFLKGKRVEILIIVEDDIDETDYILKNKALMQQITLSQQTHQQQIGYQPTAEELHEIVGI